MITEAKMVEGCGLRPLIPEHQAIMYKRGVPLGHEVVGLYSFNDNMLTAGERRYLAKCFPNLGVPEGVSGIAILYPPCADKINRLRIRLDTPIDSPRDPRKKQRYVAQAQPIPVAPYITQEAATALSDPTAPIVVTEAPLKSITLSVNGIPSLGLGGVDAGGLDTSSNALALQPELQRYAWEGRIVTIAFDANIHTKYAVALAAAKLAHAFRAAGADCRVARVPLHDGQDQGPDDFLVRHCVADMRKLIESAHPSEPLSLLETSSIEALASDLYFRAALQVGGDLLIERISKKLKVSKKAIKALVGAERVTRVRDDSVLAFARGDHAELAVHLRTHYTTAAPPVFAEGQLYQYNAERGVWSPLDPALISQRIQALAGTMVGVGEHAAPLRVTAPFVKGTIQCLHDLCSDPEFFTDARKGVGFSNGFASVNRDGVALSPHQHANRLRHAYAFDYVPGQRPSRFLQALEDYFGKDPDKTQKVAAIQEFSGASRTGLAPAFEISLYLFGATANNGKSTLIETLERSMPPGSTSAVRPQILGERFSVSALVGKLLNAVYEIPTAPMQHADRFKQVISGETIDYERKHVDGASFRPIAGHIYGANHWLKSDDQSNGFYRRFLIIGFNRKLEGSEVVRKLAGQIVEAELPEIVSWSLDGAVRLLQRNGYTIPESHHALMAEWRGLADSVQAWVDYACETGSKELVTREVLYASYCDWVVTSGRSRLSIDAFAQRLARWREHTRAGNRYALSLNKQAVKAPPDPEVSADDLAELMAEAQQSADPRVDTMVAALTRTTTDEQANYTHDDHTDIMALRKSRTPVGEHPTLCYYRHVEQRGMYYLLAADGNGRVAVSAHSPKPFDFDGIGQAGMAWVSTQLVQGVPFLDVFEPVPGMEV